VAENVGSVLSVSTLLMIVGFAPQAFDRREGRPGPRHPAAAFHRRDQRGLLAAHERSGPLLDLDVEGETRAEDVLAQQSEFAHLAQGVLEPLDRQRILGSDVNERVRRPMAYPAISMPSSRECGSPSISERFMNAPGSPSSALQIR